MNTMLLHFAGNLAAGTYASALNGTKMPFGCEREYTLTFRGSLRRGNALHNPPTEDNPREFASAELQRSC